MTIGRQRSGPALEPMAWASRGQQRLRTALYHYDLLLRPLSVVSKIRVAGRAARGRLLRTGGPRTVEIGLTYSCQARCGHCGVVGQERGDGRDLTISEVTRVMGQARGLAARLVVFGGGEPLLSPLLVPLVAQATSGGMMAALSTNGLLLDASMAARLRAARLSFANVSIDSADRGKHDASRGLSGSFDAATAAVRACASAGVPAIVSTRFDAESIRTRDLDHVVALARRLGARGVRLLPEASAGRRLACSPWTMTPEQRRHVEELLDPRFVFMEGVRSHGGHCSAAQRRFLYVSPYGDVQPCSFVHVSFGNIRRQPLGAIWRRMRDHSFFQGVGHEECIMRQDAVRRRLASAAGDGAAASLPLEV